MRITTSRILLLLAITACPSDEPANEGGSTGSSGGSGSATNPTQSGSQTMDSTVDTTMATTASTTSSMTDTTTEPTTGGMTTMVDSSTSAGETGTPECPYTPVDGTPAVSLQLVANGFSRPVQVVGHPTEPDRLFVVEQTGTIRILEPGETTAPDDAFFEWPVTCGNTNFIGCEQGLFSLAFHPDFPTDPRIYIAYSPIPNNAFDPPTRVAEFSLMEGDPNHVDPDSYRVIIDGAKPFGNHNGGSLAFGPDGYLYFGLGDGGDGFDTAETGRNTGVILSKILRIGVEPDGIPDEVVACIDTPDAQCDDLGPFDYTIPDDNPFVDDPDFAPEIFAWGFRNPWRFQFDPVTGDLWEGDVGQGEWEEVNIVVAGGDYGWSAMEGNHCRNDPGCDDSADANQANADGQIAPVFEYYHQGGACSITGGGVYRSCEVPGWDGYYLFGDFCNHRIYGITYDGSSVTDLGELVNTGELVAGNGYDAYGNVYFTTFEGIYGGPDTDGLVYRVAPAM
ncbi:MAG TPA: PQQ-dependent sugar dehydrogenase [Nannocystaceae bacterium]|nr:PQQ-dependent sugar dehydrogenase [Nannocystaceae bacterium]